jgi:chromosomal replication initiation ATPase DnaA
MSTQLSFNLTQRNQNQYDEADFIFCDENQEASDFLNKLPLKNQEISIKQAILLGEEKSGKTHLLNIIAQKFNAIFIDKSFDLARGFKSNKLYILEDIDEINDDNKLFHILNQSLEDGAVLIMSAKNLDVFKLTDLISRVKNIITVAIKNPSLQMSEMLIYKAFSDKQLKINSDIVKFLSINLRRKYCAIFKAVDDVEDFCFKNKRAPNLKEIIEFV